ncbi:hypothetical protein D8674_001433 [Pyrus ussuriensis x Pyrus communis]|uniref:Uncharacterized protein n=1 Tax=Pyrus ussuriensis x Pyrus communis TaxID=2448454 RepID=A0A5N5F6Z6_9ROSA|nr:hypothetical protein D8674_001433 [Pyrus ussuriensis x Pyrus communis]
MSSIIYSVFSIFLLFLSMHECQARYIVLVPKGVGATFQPSSKGLLLVEKFKTLGMDSSKGFVMKEDDEVEKVHGGAITSTTTQDTNETKDSKTPPPPVNEVKYNSRGQKSGMEHAGSEILESLGHMVGLLRATSPTTKKEARRRALSGKEAVNYNTDDKVDDNVVHTDYNPPHSTPPIHNRKT